MDELFADPDPERAQRAMQAMLGMGSSISPHCAGRPTAPRRPDRPASSRTSALAGLCQHIPPAILADLLGLSESNTARWARLSGGEWARYAAQRA